MMLTKTRVLWWIGLLCFVPLFFPTIHSNKIPNGTEGKFTLGIPSSPWLVVSWIDTEERIENGMSSSFSSNHSHSTNAELITWSALFGIVGIVLMTVSKRLGTK
jgi:hypothetical protein